ncbi:LLM class F420-dependent oxidoreductase [Frankia tisae]|uniref:LLM class F420-dependent oxidoreductase n=1 Tax=Frankia tisae TaxID=2950104 RepID=UPI0021BFEBF7|nr:LLM class F420-dependent oxidoreductase [Frankia tisae]
MDLGLAYFPTDYSMPVGDLAAAAEERGFESLFLCEHTHIPVSRRSPYPQGGELPREYSHTLDPFVAFGAIVAVTRRLRFGPGICLVTQRDPIVTAKEVASVDHLSDGRFLFGVGAGWNTEEMIDHGTDPTRRWAVARERVLAMRTIWTQEEAEFHGTFVDFPPMWSWPKPVQVGGPPVLVGGAGPRALDRVLDYGDGWFPIYGAIRSDAGERIAELRTRAADLGRPAPSVTVFGVPPEPARVEEMAAAGVDRALLLIPSEPAAQALETLDRFAGLLPAPA